MNYVLIGAGSRGLIYGTWAVRHGISIAAIAEKRPDRLRDAAEKLGVPEEMCFSDAAGLLARGKLADAAIIATMDRDHFGHTMAALDCGYDILLEKPISPAPRECVAIEEKANRLGLRITVCHVLRYTNFFGTLKEIVDSGELGRIVAIKHSENIGNYHMAHSFVRGNWRNDRFSSPIIMQKSCHDLDILLWLTGSHCTKVSAFGGLSYFRAENAPAGSAERCCDCPVRDACRFNAYRVYTPLLGQWPADVVCLEQTEAALDKALREGPYGRCVFRVIHIRTGSGGHGGGDDGIMEDFSRSLRERKTESRSSITRSVESHLMACALEQSRLTGKTVDMAQFRESLMKS